MTDNMPLEEFIDRHMRGELNEAEKEQLAELLDSDSLVRKSFVHQAEWDTRIAEALRGQSEVSGKADELSVLPESSSIARGARWIVSSIVATVLALIAGVFISQQGAQTSIAKITGVSGALRWTGDGGQIQRNLTVGMQLSGGTIEGMVLDSWFELQFRDGSTVTISGNSVLTFSDDSQKALHLKQGRLSGNVLSQPIGKPMLIFTRSAVLEVVGTRFDVEAKFASTRLNVNEGKVRVTRLNDGRVVDVAANHRAVASADQILTSVPTPGAVEHWKSNLQRGPEGTYGSWISPVDRQVAGLKAIPFTPPENPLVTLSMVGLGVSRADGSPVVLRPDSRIILRGRVKSPTQIYFGINMTHSNGEFAGKFRADKEMPMLSDQNQFEVVFDLSEFELDPCVRERKHELAHAPNGLYVTGVWCFTVDNDHDQDNPANSAGLEVTEVEIISSSDETELHVARRDETRRNNSTVAKVARRWGNSPFPLSGDGWRLVSF